MNPFALVLIGIGLMLMVIGFKGSQHNIAAAFKGVNVGQTKGQVKA